MTLSRRSFLKVAGLTVVAAAGASMFTGCSINNLLSTSVVYSAAEGSNISADTIKVLNENSRTKAIPGHSDLYNDENKRNKAINNQLTGAAVLGVNEAKDLEVASSKIVKKQKDGKDVIENGKQVYIIEATLKKKSN